MVEFQLLPDERHRLQTIVRRDPEADRLRCAQALLWLADGDKATSIASASAG